MAHKDWVAAALGIAVAASPVSAGYREPPPANPAPMAGPDAKYCLRVEPDTGSLIERIRCWTRDEWAEQGVDVDKEWAKEGVEVKG